MELKQQIRRLAASQPVSRPMAPRVLVISGASGCGKTTLCARVVGLARAQGLVVGGVLTRPRFAGERSVGLDVEDLRSGCVAPLAERDGGSDGPTAGVWHFHAAGLARGREALLQATPCHLLVVDELGPLELGRGEGWGEGLDVLAAGQYRLGLVVVRPSLVAPLQTLLGAELPVLVAEMSDCNALAGRILRELEDLG